MRESVKAGDELVEEVDLDGHVLRIVTRAQMRAERLRHRCTYISVLTGDDEIVVHKRADWKDVYPGWWDLAFGGVCDPGESWDESARRELAEEAGLSGVELEPVGPMSCEGDDGAVVGRIYLARTDAELTCPDGEVVAVDRIPVDELDAWIKGRNVCVDTRDYVWPLLHGYLKKW